MKLRTHTTRCAMVILGTLGVASSGTAQTSYANGCPAALTHPLAYKQNWKAGVAPNAMPNTGQSSLYYQNTMWGGTKPVDPMYRELAATESVTVTTGGGPNGENVLDFNTAGTPYGEDYQTAGVVFGGFGSLPDPAGGPSWWDATEGCVSVKYKWTTTAWNQIAFAPLLVLGKGLYLQDEALSLGADVYWQSGGGDHGTFDLQYPVYDANSASGVRWVDVDTYPFTRAATENQWQQFAITWRNGSTDDAVSTVTSDGWLHVYWNGTLIYDVNNIPLIMNADTASTPEGKPNRLRTLWLGYSGLFGPATNIVLTEPTQLWSSTRQVPYFGYYFVENQEQGNYDYINEVNEYSNVVVIRPDNTQYTEELGAEYDNAGLKVIVELGISEERLNHPSTPNCDINPSGEHCDFQNYLKALYEELDGAHLLDNVIAIAPGEEWNDHVVGGDEAAWLTFSGLSTKDRRDKAANLLTGVIAAIKGKFPDKPAILVDTFWNDDYSNGGDSKYHPAPKNLDILGIDAYIGYQRTGFTTDCEAAMQQKWLDDVQWKYDLALTDYWQPIVVVGQSFNDGDWPMPGICQLNWWYSEAQSHSRFSGLVWFNYGVNPGGVRYFQDHAAWLRNMYLHNQSIPAGAPDLLSPGQAILPNGSRTSIDGRFHLYYQADGNLVLYNESWVDLWSSGTNDNNPGQAVMQGDGNFVIYNGNGTPVWWTATEYSPGAYLVVQPDGNMVVYSAAAPNAPLWNSGTCCQ